jgi:hypothetical protein
MGWTVRGSNPSAGEIFRTHQNRLWGPPSLLHNGYGVSFPEVKQPERDISHPPPTSVEVKEREELYIYSPSGSSWSVLGQTLPFLPFPYIIIHFTNHYNYILHTYSCYVSHIIILDNIFSISEIYRTVIMTNMQQVCTVIMSVRRTSSHTAYGHRITIVSLTSEVILTMELIWISKVIWRKLLWQWKCFAH